MIEIEVGDAAATSVPYPCLRDGVSWEVTGTDRAVTLRLAGDLDLAAEAALEPVRREVLAASPARVVVDLRELQFIDSSGLRWLVKLERALAPTASVKLIPGCERVHTVFRLTGLDGHFAFLGHDPAEAM
jgi:anti-anti-sigma factor